MPVFEDEDEQEYIFDWIYIRCIFITLYTIVFCFCVFGNLMVILVVTLHWKMRNITKFCLGNLAFADFCVGIFCVYQNLSTYLIQSWVLGNFMCKMYQFINALSYTASLLILVVICVERYLAILHPLRCKQILTIKRLRIIIVGVWLVSALYCSPRLYYFVAYQVPGMVPGGQAQEVICIAQRTRFDSKKFDMIHFFLLFLLPLLVISVLYAKMGLFLRKSSKSLYQWSTSCQTPGTSASGCVNQKSNKSSSNLISFDSNIDAIKSNSNSTFSSRAAHNTTSTTRSNPCTINLNDLQSTASTGASITNNCEETERQQHQLPQTCNQTGVTQSVEKMKTRSKRSLTWSFGKNNRRCSQSESLHSLEGDSALTEGNVVGREHAMKSRQAVVKMLIVIVLTFALCNFPFHLRKIFQYWWPNYDYASTFSTLLTPLTQLIMYANCALNPIIYAFMSKEFRSSFKDLLCGRCRKPIYLGESQVPSKK